MKNIKSILALLFAIALVGCAGKQTASSTTTVKDEHDENLQISSYSNDFEVYAEAKPFVAGQASDILAHFSYLANFKPLEEGAVAVSLIVGTNDVRQTLEGPTRSGIYSFSLTPETTGMGKLVFDIKTGNGNSQIVVPNIKVYADVHDAQHAAVDALASSSNGVVFTKEQSWKVDFATSESQLEPFGEVIKTTAQIIPSQGDERMLTAKSSGIISFSSDNIVDGQSVNAGQSLFTIESGDMADDNMSVRYKEALNEYNRAKAEYERKSKLAEDKIVTQSELLTVKTDYENAQTVYRNLQKNFNASGRQTVKAPIGGFIKGVLVKNGEYVEAGEPIVSISQNRTLFIKAELQPKYFSILNNITSANFRIQNSDKVYSLEDLDGKVVSYGKSVGIENPLIPVVFQVNNNIGLLPGSFVEMYIKTQTTSRAVTVPNLAVVEEMGNYFVYVQLTPEFFEKTAVKIGYTDGYRTEITEGLSGDERVVSKGAILVKLAQASGALDVHSGHAH